MISKLLKAVAVLALCLISPSVPAADPVNVGKVGEPNPIPAAAAAALEKAQPAAAKALDYLVKESTAWRKDHDCATCHHGVMTSGR